jgi:hypothetical protein
LQLLWVRNLCSHLLFSFISSLNVLNYYCLHLGMDT